MIGVRHLPTAIGSIALGLVVASAAAGSDVILDWNATLRTVAQADVGTANPGWFTRSLAMLNGAMYDTFQAVSRTHEPFLVDTSDPGASRDAAATEAAYEVLLACYPDQQALLDPARTALLAVIPDGAAKTAGIVLGMSVAQQYIAARQNDGADALVPYLPTTPPVPGHWQPDPLHPAQVAWGPEWGGVATWSLTTSSQFPLPGVPAMTSQEYTDAFAEVESLGKLDSATRTLDQTHIGVFWGYDRPHMGPPPVMYDLNLAEIAAQRGNTAAQNARLFALASVAMADAAIAAWDAKFQDDFWRPVTAIRAADTDGNPTTTFDPTWTPLGAPGPDPMMSTDDFTPPFPAYPSGHATMGGAAYEILRRFYASDTISFTLHTAELPPPDDARSFTSFTQAENENATSRIYLGIHWRFDAEDGVALGNQIAAWVDTHHFQAVPEPAALAQEIATGMALLARRRFTRRAARPPAPRSPAPP